MGVSAWLTIKLGAGVSFDSILAVLAQAGWQFGAEILYYPPGVEAGDWVSRPSTELDSVLAEIRERERRRELVGFDLYLGDSAGLFLIENDSLSFQPGIRRRLGDHRTTDVSRHLNDVLLPIRRAFSIEYWEWEEDA